jgi:hypothetical protein
MTKKPETPLQPGVTANGVPFSQLDTTGYDFGGSLSQEEIDEELDRMDNDPEFAMNEDE